MLALLAHPRRDHHVQETVEEAGLLILAGFPCQRWDHLVLVGGGGDGVRGQGSGKTTGGMDEELPCDISSPSGDPNSSSCWPMM
jgi:hypothetical protein